VDLLLDDVSLAEKQQIQIMIYLFIFREQDKDLRVRATLTNALSVIFIVLAHLNKNSPLVDGRHFALP
jgi:hypothetical protein